MMSPADDGDLEQQQQQQQQPRKTLLDDDDGNNNNDRLTLRIHESGTKAGKETLVDVSRFDTVAALKRAVVLACRSNSNNRSEVNPNNYYVRLIAAGRLLAPDHARLTQFALQGQPVVHAVLLVDNDDRHKKGAQAALQQGQALSRRALRATGVNEAGWAVRRTPEDEEEEEDDDAMEMDHLMFGEHVHEDAAASAMMDLEAGHARRRGGFPAVNGSMPLGFDRLRVTAGLGRADVMALRIYFNSHIDRWIQQQEQQQQQEDGEAPPPLLYAQERDALRRRRLQEEAWMDAQGPASEFRLNLNLHSTAATAPPAAAAAAGTMITNPTLRLPEGSMLRGSSTSASVGTDRDFLWGFLLGFFVGFLMLIWIWLPTVPHKQKLGILTGYSFHLALGMLKGGNGPNDDDVIVVLD